MSLPPDILKARLLNELSLCARYLRRPIALPDGDLRSFPIEIEIELKGVPGLVFTDDGIETRYEHRFNILIGRNYPFEKPMVRWKTPIFHPNIMMPDDGGHLCTKLLDEWSFNSTLLSFIKGIEALLISPNPSSPFGTESCTAAAAYFNHSKIRIPPIVYSPLPKVVKSD
ncbi:MAG: ubiquitin-conjugating enzyme E2 [Methanomassiliicoccales archaeon]